MRVRCATALVALATAALPLVFARSSTTSSATTTSFSLTSVASPSTSSSTTASSATSTASSSSSNSTIATSIILPPLYECESSTWTFTGPVGAKYLGIYVTGTSSWIETYALSSVYDDRTSGTFSWECDLPTGLSVAAMFYVIEDGAQGTDGNQASTSDAIVLAGSSGSSCLGTNVGGDSQSTILSLASSLDPSFTYTSSASSSTSGNSSNGSSGNGSTNIGAIVGGVVGGVFGVLALALFLVYLKRKHERLQNADELSMYSGRQGSEMRNSSMGNKYMGGPGSEIGMVAPPPGTYYAHDEHGNTILMTGYPGAHNEAPLSPAVYSPPPLPTPAPQFTAPVGTLPEPMDESSTPTHYNPHSSPSFPVGPVPPSSTTPTNDNHTAPPSTTSASAHTPFTPRSERDAFLGAQGLDDPSTFATSRSRR